MAWIDADLPTDIPMALPGEVVRYRELGRGQHRARGEMLEIIKSHPARITPRCPLAFKCGSCDRMHVKLETQLEFKLEQVATALAPLGVEPAPIVGPRRPWRYRRRAKFVFAGRPGALRLGAYRAGTHDVLDLLHCPVTSRAILEARDHFMAELSRAGAPPYDERDGTGVLRHLILERATDSDLTLATLVVAGEPPKDLARAAKKLVRHEPGRPGVDGLHINVHSSTGNALLGDVTTSIAGRAHLPVKLGNLDFDAPPGAFSQINREIAAAIYKKAASWTLDPDDGGVVDLYCGMGALGMHIGAHAPWGLGIDQHVAAIDAARSTAERCMPGSWSFITGDVERALQGAHLPGKPSVVALNPPRRGATKTLLGQILALEPQRIVYVSCNPRSLARDLETLVGPYRLLEIHPFDMFPHTRHVETLVFLQVA